MSYYYTSIRITEKKNRDIKCYQDREKLDCSHTVGEDVKWYILESILEASYKTKHAIAIQDN